ncbi:MAG: hypothetical protein ACOX3P_07245 [Saccharofermentanales bacterium]|jgi:hypothetical protein|nr:hypothetical protein [Bacillota bacterium]
MQNIFLDIFDLFADKMGISLKIQQYLPQIRLSLLGLSILSCFLGIVIYRIWAGISIFFLTGIGLAILLEDKLDKGALVTVVVLLGVFAAILLYFSSKAAVFLLTILFLYNFNDGRITNYWIIGGCLLLVAVLSVKLEKETIISGTAVWGSFMSVLQFFQIFTSLEFEFFQSEIGWIVIAILGAVSQTAFYFFFVRKSNKKPVQKQKKIWTCEAETS